MRIVMASVPQLLLDLLKHAVRDSAGVETVATLMPGEDPRPTVVRLRPDVVIVGGADVGEDHAVDVLRQTDPSLTVVRLSRSGRRATVLGPGRPAVVLEDVSLNELLNVLRGPAGENGAAPGRKG